MTTCKRDIYEDMCQKKCSKALEKKEWEDITCYVCMEYQHNAILLCSSHDKGCHPYMYGPIFHHSNCLDQYNKAYTKVISSNVQIVQGTLSVLQDSNLPFEKSEAIKLTCPLCRGQVKGWIVMEHVRDYLNAKKRGCMQDECSYIGSYKQLRKHVRIEHASTCLHMVDLDREQKWRWLEWEREMDYVISIVASRMLEVVVFGDYVIEGHHNNFDMNENEGA
ncbi:hypothetical protein CR513_58506, partial [Mucuna pruriens]